MKTVTVRRIVNGEVVQEEFVGRTVHWTFEQGIFRVWDTDNKKTLVVPFQMLESVIIQE